ncbi:hypothetical protein Ctob_016701, partial [Chrysochromulina tobinii]
MDIQVTAKYHRKNDKVTVRDTVMHLTDVLVVPGLNTDLFSCNAAFDKDGIRSYFNDEKYLELEDGGRVHFAAGHDTRKSIVSYHRASARSGVGNFGDSVHVDLCGPFPPSVHTGFKYVIGFADRATREVHVYFLVHKTGDE